MGANLDRLMKSYGVSTPTVSAYSGVAAPAALKADATAGEQGAYQGALTKYNVQKAAYDQYAGDYRNRINSTNLYSSPYMNILPDSQEVAQWNNTLKTPDYSGITGSMANLSDTTTVDPTVYTNPDYNSMINAAYGSLGRTGIGTSASNIDQPGYDYWLGQLKSGAISPNDFTNKFKTGANAYIAQNPDTDYTKYVQGYLGITPAVTTATTGDTTTGDTTTGNTTTAADTYSRSYDEDGNERYAHGGPVRHFYGGGSNRIDGGMTDLANKYSLNNPAELPVIFAEAPAGKATDASASYPVSRARVTEMDASSRRTGGPGVTVASVPAGAIVPATDPAPAPVVAPPSADAARDALYDKYFKRGPDSDAVIAARKSVEDNRAALLKSINDQMGKSEENAPSKAEMYFRLAAAFAAPTKTGGFMENVGLAAKELGEFQKSTTDAKRAAAAARLRMLLKTNEITLQAATEGLADLRRREGEDNANLKAFGLELFKSEEKRNEAVTGDQKDAVAAGFRMGTPENRDFVLKRQAAREAKEKADLDKPLTETAKRLADRGILKGTPEYKDAMEKAARLEEERAVTAAGAARTAAEAAKRKLGDLSPREAELRTETEDLVANLTKSAADLKRAFAINPNTYRGSWGDRAAMFLKENLGTDDPIAINTREQMNLLSSQALSALRETFPGAISNEERKALLDLQGIGSKSLKERAIIIMRGYEALQTSLERNKKRVDLINSGYFRRIERPVEGATDGK